MDYKLVIEIGIVIAGLAVGWGAIKSQVAALTKALEETCERLETVEQSGVVATAVRAEQGAMRAHQRVDEHERRITILEERVQHQSKQVSDGLARVEASIASMGGRLEGQIANLQRRVDEAIDQRRPA